MSSSKHVVAKFAVNLAMDHKVIGVGTGSTVDCFIKELAPFAHQFEAAVASSMRTQQQLIAIGVPVVGLNSVNELSFYVDGADRVNSSGLCIKGGGGALTQEKIVASVAENWVCMVDESKLGASFLDFPIAVEVIPAARSYVARKLVGLNINPVYRENFTTDNGNIILDAWLQKSVDWFELEQKINLIVGVVENGIFATIPADKVLVGKLDGSVIEL